MSLVEKRPRYTTRHAVSINDLPNPIQKPEDFWKLVDANIFPLWLSTKDRLVQYYMPNGRSVEFIQKDVVHTFRVKLELYWRRRNTRYPFEHAP